MTRKRLAYYALFLLLVAAAGTGAGVVLWSLWQVPDFYTRALGEQPSPTVRKQAARAFVKRTIQLANEIKHETAWSEEFTQQQVNGWLAEELPQKYPDLVPEGVSQPRVQFSNDVVQLGFRLKQDRFDGVISLRLKPWVAQPNELAIEIEWVKAGLVRIPLDNVLREVSDQFHIEGWNVRCRQSDGKDILVVQLNPDGNDRPVLETVNVVEGVLKIAGRRDTEPPAPAGASVPQFQTTRVADQLETK